MKNKLGLLLTPSLVVFLLGAQAAQPEFMAVEPGLDGWDFSRLDKKVKDAVRAAAAEGAGENERLTAASALLERANYFWSAGQPRLYKFALGDFRHVLHFQPDNAEAREKLDTIVSIYESMQRPVPENGNQKRGGRYLVETFKTVPKQVAFERGKVYADSEHGVSSSVAFVYEFGARAGQWLNVNIRPKDDGAVFDLYLEGEGEPSALISGARSKKYYLPVAGKYLIRIYSQADSADYELKAELK